MNKALVIAGILGIGLLVGAVMIGGVFDRRASPEPARPSTSDVSPERAELVTGRSSSERAAGRVAQSSRAESLEHERETPHAKEPRAKGTLEVRVRDRFGVAIPKARVDIEIDKPETRLAGHEFDPGDVAKRTLTVDARGHGRLTLVPGVYRVAVQATGLPAGVAAPLVQSIFVRASDVPEHYGRWVDVEAGSQSSVELTCLRLGSVSGRVVRSDGGSVDGLQVRVRVKIPGGSRGFDTRTDAVGAFVVDDVLPGAIDVLAWSPASEEPRLRSMPAEATLTAGGQVDAGVLRLVHAGATIRGRIVDLEGRPFDDFDMLVYPASTNRADVLSSAALDARGRFRLERVPTGEVRVATASLGAELETWMEPVAVHVHSSKDDIDLGEIRLKRARSFRLTAKVQVANSDQRDQVALRVRHVLPGLEGFSGRRLQADEESTLAAALSYPKEMAFSWQTRKPLGKLEVTLTGKQLPGKTWEIHVSPGGRETLTFDATPFVADAREER